MTHKFSVWFFPPSLQHFFSSHLDSQHCLSPNMTLTITHYEHLKWTGRDSAAIVLQRWSKFHRYHIALWSDQLPPMFQSHNKAYDCLSLSQPLSFQLLVSGKVLLKPLYSSMLRNIRESWLELITKISKLALSKLKHRP